MLITFRASRASCSAAMSCFSSCGADSAWRTHLDMISQRQSVKFKYEPLIGRQYGGFCVFLRTVTLIPIFGPGIIIHEFESLTCILHIWLQDRSKDLFCLPHFCYSPLMDLLKKSSAIIVDGIPYDNVPSSVTVIFCKTGITELSPSRLQTFTRPSLMSIENLFSFIDQTAWACCRAHPKYHCAQFNMIPL